MTKLALNVNPFSEAQATRKRELQEKLQSETDRLDILKNSLQKIDELTEQMQFMLGSFDDRLTKLESFILPIHRSTQKITKLHSNIDRVLLHIQGFTGTIDVIKQYEIIVRKGPQDIELSEYIEAISKLKNCLQSLESTKFKSSERTIQGLKETLWKGVQQLDGMFGKELQAASDSIDPALYNSEFPPDSPLISEAKIKHIQSLASALMDSIVEIGPTSAFTKIYEEVRSAHLNKVLAPSNQAAHDQELKSNNARAGSYQAGTNLLIPYSQVLVRVLIAEHTLHQKIVPKQQAIATYVKTVTIAIDSFITVGETMLNRVSRQIQRREGNDVYVLIDVWDYLKNLFSQHAALVAYCGKKGFELEQFLEKCSSAVLTYFKEVYEDLKVEPDKKQSVLSADGTVHETTSTTINILKRSLEFSKQMGHLIASNKSKTGSFVITSFADFVSKIVEALLTDLETKSKGYKKPILANIFLLNNYHYVFKGISTTKLSENIVASLLDTVDKSIKKQLDLYRASWMSIVEHLMDTTKISDQGKIVVQLSKQQRDAVKEKFKNFNKDFDELYQTQKAYAVPDVELRALVVKDIKQIIVPMYNRFYDKYTEIEFAKTPEKYIKYDKEAFSATLDKFFDASG